MMTKKYIFFILLLFPYLSFSQGKPVSESEARTKVFENYDISKHQYIHPDREIEALNKIIDYASQRVPFLTATQLRAGKADTSQVVQIIKNGQIFTYCYDANCSTEDDSATVLRHGNRRYVINVERITPQIWGAVPNDGKDDIVALQKASDYCIKAKRNLYIPAGDYNISRPWIIGRRSGAYTFSNYASLSIEGEAAQLESSQNATRILPSYNNTFAIGITNSRGIKISKIKIDGQNPVNKILTAAQEPLLDINNYVLNGSRDSQYSPYAGIVIDPFSKTVPEDGGYPGMTAYYNSSVSGTAKCTFEDVVVTDFVVGFLIEPYMPGAPLGSEITWRNCVVKGNKVGVASCNNQNRNLLWYGGSVGTCYYAFDGASYGTRTGNIPHIFGGNYGGKYLFNAKNANGESTVKAWGMHAERFGGIGFFGGAGVSGTNPAILTDCRFSFGFPTSSVDHHIVAYSSILFQNCVFANTKAEYEGAPLRIWKWGAVNITFQNCSLSSGGGNLALPVWADSEYNFIGNSLAEGGHNQGGSQGSTELTSNKRAASKAALNRHTLTVQTIQFADDPGSIYYVNKAVNTINLGTQTLTKDPATGTATFTVDDPGVVKVGDHIINRTTTNYESYLGTKTLSSNVSPIGTISAISGSTITISGIPESINSGNYNLFSTWWSRYHEPTIGDVISGQNVIRNVSKPDAWKVGNHITGAGIALGTYITAISGNTFTISKNAIATNSGTKLFDTIVYKVTGTQD
ncbi:hypothetical protein [Telluribacter sp. SYSU D00476]|uniref:hypothetical protein n=1 Tax=Telluribacter sp. SYSU D00476 TaxID=2811430 RepID=UPI001FF5319E|nr:hypothetical protein [Telluribacter sp. SYSU D00476]